MMTEPQLFLVAELLPKQVGLLLEQMGNELVETTTPSEEFMTCTSTLTAVDLDAQST